MNVISLKKSCVKKYVCSKLKYKFGAHLHVIEKYAALFFYN